MNAEASLVQIETLPQPIAARICDGRLREIEQESIRTFTELGEICRIAEERELWRYVIEADGYAPHSFTDWIHRCLPVSHGSAFAALGVSRVLGAIPVAERDRIPRSNLELMARLSEQVATAPKVRRAAQEQKPKEFRSWIETEFPNQHIEALELMQFRPERSAKRNIEEAIEMAMALEECSRNQALEAIAVHYADTHRGPYTRLRQNSNSDSRESVQ